MKYNGVYYLSLIENNPITADYFKSIIEIEENDYIKIYDEDKILWEGKVSFKIKNNKKTFMPKNINEKIFNIILLLNFRAELNKNV